MFKPKSSAPLGKQAAKKPKPPSGNNELVIVDKPKSFADQVKFTSDQSSDDDDSETENDLDTKDEIGTTSCNCMPSAPPHKR
jgi:hypothetical protein